MDEAFGAVAAGVGLAGVGWGCGWGEWRRVRLGGRGEVLVSE